MTLAARNSPAAGADTLDDQLTAEREHLATSRDALRRMRERAEALYATGDKVAGDAYTAEQLGRHMARRVAELADDPTTPLFFGRLTFADARYHIGRRHVTDDLGEPLVLDWRAPVSRSFYRASARDPQGVSVRRRFGFSAGALTSFEDEHLDRGEELGTASRILTAEIERPRVGPMRDIVATIQPEQDELVRADLADSICVQGAPGTGKTAVGLHRAAYLLYLHRERLRRSGVLIVGPNRAFLSYIAAVLPALGEVEVEQATVEDLIARAPVRAVDDPAVAALKHDVRMAEVLRRAIERGIGAPTEPIMVSDGSFRWRIGLEPLHRVVEETRREGLPYATGRERVRARVVSLLQRQAEARRAESPSDAWLRRMGRCRPVTEFLDAVWPALTPEGLVHTLLADPAALAAAADGVLTEAEQALLTWAKPPRTPKAAKWAAADAVLVDEAAGLLERPASFGHVVVDEAQDLSPMQCRAIARRSEHGSITLLGDLAQGTAPWAARDWRASLAHLGKPDAAVVPLSVGFRVPAAVVAFANRLLPALSVDVPPAESLRRDGTLDVRAVADLAAAAVAEVRAALAHDGSVGVIAADDAVAGLRAALADAGIDTATADDVEAAARVTVVPATMVKGLEYDHVVVVEPAAIVAAEPRGLNRLYVVLTRAVSRLAVLHTAPLPEALR
ncbi:AAA family ATPase [Micromonospora olivasterospora]|uniref:DNA helicase IV n=1 Tax=Micromonospora olivasterospora TaxID=1880 RepID=A0A562IAV7_MICOL|nr:AAA family ATPase [Micromonospora olivasterospora]TWH67855.1 DNA helicase IV [Micromonospora olivasterospora]